MERFRSWMFVPGHVARMVDKALGLPVDALILDLEDGVLPASKPLARLQIAAALAVPAGGAKRFVRINAIGHADAQADLDAIAVVGCDGIVVPKVDTIAQIHEATSMLAMLEQRRSIGTPLKIVAAIESAIGLLRAFEIASASERVCGLMLGAEDLATDIGLPIRREAEAHDLIYARSLIVTAATAARVQSIDQLWPDISDTDGLQHDALQARRLGFSGKSLIHPTQIDPVHRAFSPTPQELDFARKVVDAFQEAESRGLGSVAFGGQLLDKPIVERARATLALGERLGLAEQRGATHGSR